MPVGERVLLILSYPTPISNHYKHFCPYLSTEPCCWFLYPIVHIIHHFQVIANSCKNMWDVYILTDIVVTMYCCICCIYVDVETALRGSIKHSYVYYMWIMRTVTSVQTFLFQSKCHVWIIFTLTELQLSIIISCFWDSILRKNFQSLIAYSDFKLFYEQKILYPCMMWLHIVF